MKGNKKQICRKDPNLKQGKCYNSCLKKKKKEKEKKTGKKEGMLTADQRDVLNKFAQKRHTYQICGKEMQLLNINQL